MRPFIYIAGMRRTGSTLLQEVLSTPPKGWVFHETNIKTFQIRSMDRAAMPLDGIKGPNLLGLIPQMEKRGIEQIGIKQIGLGRWRKVLKHFPDAKVLVTARDPRDTFISLHHRGKTNSGREAALNLMKSFGHQMALMEETPHITVRYEDICRRPEVWVPHVRKWCECPEGDPEIGAFIRRAPGRCNEFEVHGARITDKHIGRWKGHPLEKEALVCFQAMSEYAEYWGYE